MICYPFGLSELEIKMIDDYWTFSDEECLSFQYSLNTLDAFYKSSDARPIRSLMRKASFCPIHNGFACRNCSEKSPASSRTDYKRRVLSKVDICQKCLQVRRAENEAKAHECIDAYKVELFKPADYLDVLSTDELLVLAVLSGELKNGNQYLGCGFEDVSVTGVPSIDQRLLGSLVAKKALILIDTLPDKVKTARSFIYGEYSRLDYDYGGQYISSYRRPGSVMEGLYLNFPIIDGVEVSNVFSTLEQKLRLSCQSVEDAPVLLQVIKAIQRDKLYRMADSVCNEYRILLDNSQVLASLFDHLAENYSPLILNFLFNVKAREVAARIHKEGSVSHISKRYFASLVGGYINRAEEKGWSLVKTWGLPSEIQSSPFEAAFSLLFLNGHFDWNRLSAKEVIALWLQDVRSSEELEADVGSR